jgi:hypothetical protein
VTMLPRRLARRDERPSRPMGAFTAVLAASCGGASRHCAGQGAPTRRRPAKRLVAAPRRGLDGARRIARFRRVRRRARLLSLIRWKRA